MNVSSSECSSGCESGWTMYLDQLSNHTDTQGRDFAQNYKGKGEHHVNENHEDDEDLSMVSDASSGPPHLHEKCAAETPCYGYAASVSEDIKKGKQKSKTKETWVKKQQNLCFDDTATSPVFRSSQGNVAPPENHNSQVFSAAHYEGESIPKKHLGFFKTSTKGKSDSLLGKKGQ